jgi:hypothetical protein
MSFLTLSICLSDIPRDRIKLAENGKMYCNLVCAKRKEVGQYGDTHYIAMSQTKEDREAGKDKI